jgi:hypothetical protein
VSLFRLTKKIIVFYEFGYNQYNISNNACYEYNDSIHAEVACVQKLKKCHKKKNISLIVFRTNKTASSLLNSKPCYNCIKNIYSTLHFKNYKLINIWYTNNHGKFEKY